DPGLPNADGKCIRKIQRFIFHGFFHAWIFWVKSIRKKGSAEVQQALDDEYNRSNLPKILGEHNIYLITVFVFDNLPCILSSQVVCRSLSGALIETGHCVCLDRPGGYFEPFYPSSMRYW